LDKVDLLFFLEDGITDDNLIFNNEYIPKILEERFSQIDFVGRIFISINKSYKGRLQDYQNILQRKEIDDLPFWKDIFSKSTTTSIAKIFIDSPFIETDIVKEMFTQHSEFLAEYTYSENLPQGLTCEIFSRELIENLPDLSEKTLQLGSVIKSNINEFDVELFYKEPDLRSKRINFRSSDPRDLMIMENLYKLKNDFLKYSELKKEIENNPGVLYTTPNYVEIELTDECNLDCIFCYRNNKKNKNGNMPLKTFQKIIDDLNELNTPYNISLTGAGEPLMHPEFYKILKIAIEQKLIDKIIVETNGIFTDSNYYNFLQENSSQEIITIVNINASNKEDYKKIHGEDFFEIVTKNLKNLKKLNELGKRLYLQIMKINETEPFLDSYYDFWEKEDIPIILQKQNTYLGLIEDRRYSDLTPMERIPCWHLQRDLLILANGTVAFCKQDIDGNFSTANILQKSLKKIWEDKKENFIANYKGNFSKNPDCQRCDEWYTFNL